MSSPIKLDRLVQELEKLKTEMDAGQLQHGEYDQRLARVLSELRERGIEGERADVNRTLEDVLERGVITPGVKAHLEKRLGLV